MTMVHLTLYFQSAVLAPHLTLFRINKIFFWSIFTMSEEACMSVKHDPLSVIFERHLFHYGFSDVETDDEIDDFITKVADDYFEYLKYLKVTIPEQLMPVVEEEIRTQIDLMLKKKIYGHMKITDFVEKVKVVEALKASEKYNKLF